MLAPFQPGSKGQLPTLVLTLVPSSSSSLFHWVFDNRWLALVNLWPQPRENIIDDQRKMMAGWEQGLPHPSIGCLVNVPYEGWRSELLDVASQEVTHPDFYLIELKLTSVTRWKLCQPLGHSRQIFFEDRTMLLSWEEFRYPKSYHRTKAKCH